MKKQKIVVAYSGGLDTSVMVKWLKNNYDADIITLTGNLGQTKELNGLEEKISKELDFITIKVEVPEEEIKKELIKEGYLFENKGHLEIKKLK